MQIRDRIKDFRRVKASTLKPSAKNWRTHPKTQADALRGILAEVGYVDALMARELPDGSLQLVDGHLRAETTPDMDVPVLVVDLNDEEAAKVLTTFDPLSAMAESNKEQLKALLQDVETKNEELGKLLESIARENRIELVGEKAPGLGGDDFDTTPKDAEHPRCKPGDLWLLGEHRLLCGDATREDDVRRLLDNAKAEMCCTDPPYGVNFQDQEGKNLAADIGYSVIPGFFGIAVDNLKPGKAMLCFGAEINFGLYTSLFGRELKMRPRLLFWKKPSFVLRHHDYHSQFEMVFYGWSAGGDAGTRWCGDHKQSDVWEVAHDADSRAGSENRKHPTQKPVELFAIPMRNHTRPGDVCYEPFAGSGTQIIAAERLGRRCFAMEIEPRYASVILDRWEAETGRKATLQPKEVAHVS